MGEIKGLRELGENLRMLGDEVGSKIARQATGRAARLMKDEEVRLAPEAPEDYVVEGTKVPKGNVKKQIVVKRVKSNDTKLTSEHLVTVRGKKRYGYASRVLSIYEFGSVKQPARPVVRRAWDGKKQDAADEIAATLRRGIANAVKKAKK